MTTEPRFTPTPELMQEWLTKWKDKRSTVPYDEFFATQAARWGADQQLKQDARWLDTCALFSEHLTITPPGDALRQAMRPKSPSLKDQSLALIDKIQSNKEMWQTDDLDVVRRALEALPNV
jgi:hypothetical protein